MPVGEASAAAVNASGIGGYSGVQVSAYTSRFYEPNLARPGCSWLHPCSSHRKKYNTYRRLGVQRGGTGRAGKAIEKWGESYLHGRNAATLSRFLPAALGAYETGVRIRRMLVTGLHPSP